MRTARRISQVLFFLLFLWLFLITRYPYEHGIASDWFLRLSPLSPLFLFIKDLQLQWFLWPALIILALTVFLGRFFCGWICPLGTLIDLSSKIVKSPDNRSSARFQNVRFVKFALLAGFVLLAIMGVHWWGYFDPLSLFNRALTVVFYPFATFLIEPALLGLADIAPLETPAYWLYDHFKWYVMPENQAHYQQVAWIALFIFLILAAEKISRRFWCRNLCPAGALLGFLSQFRFYERLVGEQCPVCNKCVTDCKMNAIPQDDVGRTSKVECIECFNCGEVCPDNIKAITYRWRWRPYHTSVDYSRRQFLGTTAASITALGLLSVNLKDRSHTGRQVRPPGALPEDDFRDRCIRCLECVRVCASNGACLQPSGIQTSIDDLWLPIANMRQGYCEYNCNLCTQVCPTDALLPLSLEQKKKTPIGLAHFDKNLCIPYDRHEDCLVCEEHCPTLDKAIKFDVRDYTDPQTGITRKVKYPYVVKELCIGCGICVYKCPLVGEPGIFVTTNNQLRLGNLQ
ncbi:4Fe-4S binding protein [Calditrichota bacterium LG25]